MNAIVLCSGLSSRLYPLTKELPKCMLSINSATILDRILQSLKTNGIQDIVIVVGHAQDKIRLAYSQYEIVSNPFYADYGDLYTVYAVKDYLQDNSLILNGDIIFDQKVLSLFSQQTRPELLVQKRTAYDAEDVLVVKENGHFRLDKNLHNHAEPLGEYIGISKIGEKDLFLRNLEEMVGQGSKQLFHEHVFQQVSRLVKLGVIDIGAAYYNEIDTPEDYQRVKATLKGE